MTADFEALLRADLRAAAPDLGIDPERVLASGRRAVRRRLTAGAGAVAVVAVLAGGWWTLALPSLTPPPPAAPTALAPTPHEVAAVAFTEPPANTSARAFDPAADYGRVDVSIVDQGSARTVEVRGTIAGVAQPVVRAGGAASDVVAVDLARGYRVVVLPAAATWWTAIEPGTPDGVVSAQRQVSGPCTVVLSRADGLGARPAAHGYEWRTADGVFHNNLGQVLPATDLFDGADTLTVYHDTGLGQVGALRDGASTTFAPDAGAPVDTGGWMVLGADLRLTAFAVLPAGSRDIAFSLVAGVTQVRTATVEVPGLGIVAAVTATVPTDASALVDSLTWLDAAGARHTHTG